MRSMPPTVQTEYGALAGEQRAGHVVFRAIPYAKPPVGKLRFRAPEPPEPWSGVRSSPAFGASAMQGAMFAPGVLAEGPQNEDCLYLNVFTPAVDGAKRPVMFFIHGGAFTVGAGSMPLYDGAALAEQHDVVLVTINYRLGALGYLPFGPEGARWGAADNRGQLDQIAALRWVQGNIERFGGDPARVTIFGESAGGTAVNLLLATPSARGLFSRAIVQSGTGPLQLPLAEQAERTRVSMLRALDFPANASERLAQLPIEQLMEAQAKVESDAKSWPHFYPVVDGTMLPAQPGELLASGQGSAVPLIIGTNRDEWNLFAIVNMAQWNSPLSDGDAMAKLEAHLPASAAGSSRIIFDAYRRSRKERGLAHGNRAILRAIEGDLRFRIPSLRFAEHYLPQQSETYAYLFTYESPALNGLLGACHALELPFVFGTHTLPNQDKFAGRSETVDALSRTMMSAWTSFAHGRAPSAESFGSWARYDVQSRHTLELGAEPKLAADPYGEERRAWDGVI
jgi:para-nitrobenzyl esterase